MSDVPDIELVEFKIVLDSIWHNDPPKYEILLNDTLIDTGSVVEKEENGEEKKIITFSSELAEGDYIIKIRLCDKQDKHTLVDENGNILADQLLNIKQIEIDEIELDYLFYSMSDYHRQIDTIDGSPVFDETPLPEKYKNLGWNGEYRLKFSVPTYTWFLENL